MMGGNVCRAHGGAAPQTKAKAQRRLQQAADVLVQRLLSFALDGDVADPVALAAIRDALDRAGMNAKTAVEITAPYRAIFESMESGGSRAQFRRSMGIEDNSDSIALPPADTDLIVDAEIDDDDGRPRRRVCALRDCRAPRQETRWRRLGAGFAQDGAQRAHGAAAGLAGVADARLPRQHPPACR